MPLQTKALFSATLTLFNILKSMFVLFDVYYVTCPLNIFLSPGCHGQGKVREKQNFFRLGKSQGIF